MVLKHGLGTMTGYGPEGTHFIADPLGVQEGSLLLSDLTLIELLNFYALFTTANVTFTLAPRN